MNNLKIFTAEYVSLNKSIMNYTDHMLYKQYNQKEHSWDFKIYYVNFKSGYRIKFKICTDQDIIKNSNANASKKYYHVYVHINS